VRKGLILNHAQSTLLRKANAEQDIHLAQLEVIHTQALVEDSFEAMKDTLAIIDRGHRAIATSRALLEDMKQWRVTGLQPSREMDGSPSRKDRES